MGFGGGGIGAPNPPLQFGGVYVGLPRSKRSQNNISRFSYVPLVVRVFFSVFAVFSRFLYSIIPWGENQEECLLTISEKTSATRNQMRSDSQLL